MLYLPSCPCHYFQLKPKFLLSIPFHASISNNSDTHSNASSNVYNSLILAFLGFDNDSHPPAAHLCLCHHSKPLRLLNSQFRMLKCYCLPSYTTLLSLLIAFIVTCSLLGPCHSPWFLCVLWCLLFCIYNVVGTVLNTKSRKTNYRVCLQGALDLMRMAVY